MGVVLVPQGRLRLGRDLSPCEGVAQGLRPVGTPENVRQAKRASTVGGGSGFLAPRVAPGLAGPWGVGILRGSVSGVPSGRDPS